MAKQVLDGLVEKGSGRREIFGGRERELFGNWAILSLIGLPWDLNIALLILVLFKSIKILLI